MGHTGLEPRIEISCGAVRVNAIYLMKSSPDIDMLEIQLHSKYASAYLTNVFYPDDPDRGESFELTLVRNEGTLYLDESKLGEPTTISISSLKYSISSGFMWFSAIQQGKYNVIIFIYQDSAREKELWRDAP